MTTKARNRIAAVLDVKREMAMNERLWEQACDIAVQEFNTPHGLNVGIETEFFGWDSGEPLDEDTRDRIIGKGDSREPVDGIEHELGATMMEIATDPVYNLSSLDQLYRALIGPEEQLQEQAQDHRTTVVRHGTNPSVDLDNIQLTSEPKYQNVPAAYDKMRVESVPERVGTGDGIDPRNAGLPGTLCSTQLNLQADSLDDAVAKANIGYAIAPYIMALSGNARFHSGTDTGHSDARMELWENAFDIGTFYRDEIDVGRIDSYFHNYMDYIQRIARQPRIMNDETLEPVALTIGEGMYWKDVRIKATDTDDESLVMPDELLVEYRPVSTQPTPEEDIAVHGFFLGRVAYQQEVAGFEPMDDLPAIETVNRNRYAAMRDGMDAELYSWDGRKGDASAILEQELAKARSGLAAAGVSDPGYLDLLEKRLVDGTAPSDETAAIYNNLLGDMNKTAEHDLRQEAITESVKRMSYRSDQP